MLSAWASLEYLVSKLSQILLLLGQTMSAGFKQSKYMHRQYLKMHNMSSLLPLWVAYHDSTTGYDAIPMISCQYGIIGEKAWPAFG